MTTTRSGARLLVSIHSPRAAARRPRADRCIAVILTATVCARSLPTFAQAVSFTSVALSGQSAPGLGAGIVFSAIDLGVGFPFINNAGQVAFTAFVAGPGVAAANDKTIWVGSPGALSLVAREGDAAPGLPGLTIADLFDNFSPALNAGGRVAFRAFLAGPGVTAPTDQAMWTGSPGALSLMAREGAFAPGPWIPGFMTFASFDPPLLNNADQVCFFGTTNNTTDPRDRGIWFGAPGFLTTAVFEQDPAPGTGPDITFLDYVGASVRLNGPGQIAFMATIIGPGVVGTNNQGLWAGTPGSVHLMAREGNSAPGMGPDPPSVGTYVAIEDPVLNDSGAVAWRGFLSGAGITTANDFGIWRGLAAGVTGLVMQEGGAVLDLPIGHTYNNFEALFGNGFPRMNAANQVAFRARVAGPSITAANDVAVFALDDVGYLGMVVREGDAAPGTPAGVTFGAFQGLPAASVSPVMNAAGQVAFLATVTGPGVSGANDLGIWATDPYDVMHLVVREGQAVEVAPGDVRTVGVLRPITGTGGSNGRHTSFNDNGRLVFRADFTNGTSGILIADVNAVCVPTIVDQPDAVVALVGGEAEFSVAATGPGILAYQWRRNGVDLTDGGNVSGATTSTLHVTPDAGDGGFYDVVVSNDCGATVSTPAELTVCLGPPDGDMNTNGQTNGDDIGSFVSAALAGASDGSAVCHGDFNADGIVSGPDIPGFHEKLLNP